ncbi:C4-dicarboxylate ABC transporter permease, partial [Azospirillum brasilense]|nr:C4-dicarboxylate ABC transporter permease [Azospirillum brasilense]
PQPCIFAGGIMLAVGVVGCFMQRWDYPASPVVLALIMGPMAEASFRRALSLSGGSLDFLYTRPITLGLLTVAVITLALPLLRYFRGNGGNGPTADGAAAGTVGSAK